MLTEKGTLPVGVEFEGKIHTEYEIREELVRDSIDIYDDPGTSERANNNKYYAGICALVKRICKIGSIPANAITADLIMGANIEDLREIQAASERLEVRAKSFRGNIKD